MNQQTNDEVGIDSFVTLMANVINYLNVSCYEGCFTYSHEQARSNLNKIYGRVSNAVTYVPSLEDCYEFYENVMHLRIVTLTDDPDYYRYICELRYLIALYKDEPENKTVVYIPTEKEVDEYYAEHNVTDDELMEDEENWLAIEIAEWTERTRYNLQDDDE